MSMDLVEGPRAPQKERQRIRGSQGSARLLNVSLAEALVAVAMGSRCRFCDLQSKKWYARLNCGHAWEGDLSRSGSKLSWTGSQLSSAEMSQGSAYASMPYRASATACSTHMHCNALGPPLRR